MHRPDAQGEGVNAALGVGLEFSTGICWTMTFQPTGIPFMSYPGLEPAGPRVGLLKQLGSSTHITTAVCVMDLCST